MSTFNVSYIVYFLFAVDFWNTFGTGLEEGDQCLFKDGTLGICKFLTSCPPALESLQVGIFPQNVCGFQGTKSIFCCRETGPVINPTPDPTKITAVTPQHTPTATEKPKLPSRTPGEISRQMCKKYMEFIPDSYECPFSDDMTVGSSFASRQEFPHMAILGYGNEEQPNWLCGGSLISEEFVLTPAFCLLYTPNSGPPLAVRIGETSLNDTDHLQIIKIKEVIVHPEYKRPSGYNDIGLVRLEKKVNINNYARPACLFTETEIGIEKAINTGWGNTELGGAIDNRLQKLTLEIYTEDECNKTYHGDNNKIPKGITYDTMVCAGTKAIATPQPQTGGPLIIRHKEDGIGNKCISDIIGVASFGKGGLSKNVPDVYTKVSAFIPWIEENVWK